MCALARLWRPFRANAAGVPQPVQRRSAEPLPTRDPPEPESAAVEPRTIERRKNLALPVTQFTGPDAPRSHVRLSQRVPTASKQVPEDVPEQRDREGYASGAPLPLARATGRAARARGPDPGARHHRELRNCATTVGAIPPRALTPWRPGRSRPPPPQAQVSLTSEHYLGSATRACRHFARWRLPDAPDEGSRARRDRRLRAAS
jgi:hypothetical protein